MDSSTLAASWAARKWRSRDQLFDSRDLMFYTLGGVHWGILSSVLSGAYIQCQLSSNVVFFNLS